MKLLWKCTSENFESHSHKWKVGKWFKVSGEIELCGNGFHASDTIMDAYSYITPGWICRVAVKGNSDIGNDQSAWEYMRIVKRYKWDDVKARELSIYSAELVLPIFEKEYPNDKSPRMAIEIAQKYLRGKATKSELDAAWAAARAAARAAASAAAWAAASAAAWAAAWAAASAAAWAAAWAAAGAAAGDAALKKIERKIKQLIGAK